MPLPFALNHINLWLLEDGDGWCIVDTGYGVAATHELWERLFAGPMQGRPVTRIIVTHYHPDHIGCAGWLQAATGAPVHITEAEFLTAWAVREGLGGWGRASGNTHFASHGLDATRLEAQATRGNSYRTGVPTLPATTVRIFAGDTLVIGKREWRIRTVFGHAPEHATLYSPELGVLISGDQILPRITTNVGVWGAHPEDDPLMQFMTSVRSFGDLPADTLVLPSHDRPFTGLHARLDELLAHHAARLADVESACAAPRTAADILPVLFKRELDDHQLMFAMAEAIAHLNHLWHAGRLRRSRGGDNVLRFARPGTAD
ncbi:MAG: MBL fold metallo-hydrolase [Betaproteobacteria bacterium]|nr:MBL fold metallo-hydrolase [Betaproteobacteria bacterium]